MDTNQDTTQTESNDAGDEAGKDQQEEGKSIAAEETPADDGKAKDGEDQGKDGEKEAPEVPDSPDKYDLTIPDDIGLKDENGDPLQFSADDPLAKSFRDFLHENKLSQAAASGLVKLYAEAIKGNITQTQTAATEKETARRNKEVEKLETTDAEGKKVSGGTRIENLNKALKATFGAGASKIIQRGITNADEVIEVEKLLASLDGTAGKGDQTDDLEGLRGAARLKAIRNRGK